MEEKNGKLSVLYGVALCIAIDAAAWCMAKYIPTVASSSAGLCSPSSSV